MLVEGGSSAINNNHVTDRNGRLRGDKTELSRVDCTFVKTDYSAIYEYAREKMTENQGNIKHGNACAWTWTVIWKSLLSNTKIIFIPDWNLH